MADRHPYIPTQSYLVQVINHLRKSFPLTITADTLKKLGFAQRQESYILNILRFLGLIDQEGNRTEPASTIFSLQNDVAFSKEFGALVAKAYSDLFDLHGDEAWRLDTDALITFFRQSDQTTEVVGRLQASAFQLLATLSGRREAPEQKASAPKPSAGATKKRTAKAQTPSIAKPEAQLPDQADMRKRDLGLTVRIEINLPANGDQETYDRIFRSIRENLLNG